MKSFYELSKKELEDYFVASGKKKFLATQVFEWVYKKKVFNPDMFLNMSLENREYIKNEFSFNLLNIKKIEEDKDVSKFLFLLNDNEYIEA